MSYNQQEPLQPTFHNHFYQESLPAALDESVNARPSQQAESQLETLHQQDANYIATSNEIPEVDSYSNYHNPPQADMQSIDSQQPQQSHFNNQEHFQPEASQTTFAGTYDYYNQSPSIHQTLEVS